VDALLFSRPSPSPSPSPFLHAVAPHLPLWREVEQDTHRKWLETHAALASRLGSKGIPSVFVNGRHVSGARPFAFWKQLVDEEIATARRLMRERRLTPARVYETFIKGSATALPG
jgi:hypothetical protein